MCDYSLCGLPARLATEGEELVVHRFRSGSVGLTSAIDLWTVRPPAEPAPGKTIWARVKSFLEGPAISPSLTVVCIPPGAQVILKDIPKDLQRDWSVAAEECAFFVQTSAEVNQYRDALRFRMGPPVLLQELREGMRVLVVSLGGSCAESYRELAAPSALG